MSDVMVIAGPTASGKSAAAMDLAQRIDGEIINADAMQVYADLSIVTARPTAEEMGSVPHHLYGIADAQDHWSAGYFARQAARVIEDICSRGHAPILVGGTGLWLKALMDGLSPIPNVPTAIMDEAKTRLDDLGMTAFREEVLELDPAMERLKPADTQRHLRAWSVFRATGERLSDWQDIPPQKVSTRRFIGHVLAPARELLYRRCDARFIEMMAKGALTEVEQLVSRKLPPSLPLMKAVGVPELAALIAGELSRRDAVEAAQQATRRLAKRQMTWFRGQMAHARWAETGEELSALMLSGRHQ